MAGSVAGHDARSTGDRGGVFSAAAAGFVEQGREAASGGEHAVSVVADSGHVVDPLLQSGTEKLAERRVVRVAADVATPNHA
jgi:hypothetical protein